VGREGRTHVRLDRCHYFPTKEALLQSAATTLRLDIQAFVAASVRVGDEPKKLLRQVLLALINLNPDQVLASHAFLAFTAADPHVHRLYRDGSAAVTAAITDLIATAGGPGVAADAEARILLGLAGSLADARMLGEIDLRQATAVLDLQLQRIHQS
jgi:AcrR family transcriptional regulator